MRSPVHSVLLAVFMTVPLLYGHQSPVHVVEDLSENLATQGSSAKLLTARGYEYQSLGNWSAAVADFNAALELDSHARSAIAGCAEASLNLGDFGEAEKMCRRGLALVVEPAEQAPYYALLARIMTRESRWLDALDAWQMALLSPQSEVDWFLGESEALARLGRLKERVKALSQAIERNPSIVLRRAWIRALVDAGEFDVASREIERGISQSRWQSFWLLLRAQVHGQNQNHDEQRVDAATAFAEIKSRLSPEYPDPYLLVEAAKALAYLGDQGEALAYLEKARSHGVSEKELSLVAQLMEYPN